MQQKWPAHYSEILNEQKHCDQVPQVFGIRTLKIISTATATVKIGTDVPDVKISSIETIWLKTGISKTKLSGLKTGSHCTSYDGRRSYTTQRENLE